MQRHWNDEVIVFCKRTIVCRQGCQNFTRAESALILKVLDCFTEWLRGRAASAIQRPRPRLAEGWRLVSTAVAKMIRSSVRRERKTTTRAQRRLNVMDERSTRITKILLQLDLCTATETAM